MPPVIVPRPRPHLRGRQRQSVPDASERGRTTMTMNSLGAGLMMAAALSGAPQDHTEMRVSQLHAGSTRADVQRVLGTPTVATSVGSVDQDNVALLYTGAPVRTRV